MPASSELPATVDVLIVGTGVGGVSAAYFLQRDHPGRTYAVLDARASTGGTWDQFRYPGVRSDSDLQTFGFAFKPWTGHKSMADGQSILEYIRETTVEFGIDERIWLSRRVVSANWVSADAQWHVEVHNSETGETESIRCRWLHNACGLFNYDRGFTPDFPGRQRFTGTLVHPQFWPQDLDLRGKRVVVIGSGATAITLIPSILDDVEHVTMLQRSPGYILPWPEVDRIANGLRRVLGNATGHTLARQKNVLMYTYLWKVSQRYPELARRLIRRLQKNRLPSDFDYETHLTPRYNPWDERMCMAPKGDFFAALRSGKAEIVTDRIATFTEDGIELESGKQLEADVIVSATGFELGLFGGMKLSVDGAPVSFPETVVFRSAMLSGIPNFTFVWGYTNVSWTLKVDLVSEYLARSLSYLDEQGADACVPRAPKDMSLGPFMDFQPGYVRRSIGLFPKVGDRDPWDMPMWYRNDVRRLQMMPVGSHELELIRRDGAAGGSARPALQGAGR